MTTNQRKEKKSDIYKRHFFIPKNSVRVRKEKKGQMMINPNAFGLKSPFFGQTQRGERRETNSFDTVDLMTFSFYFSLSLALNVFIVTPFNSEVGFCLVITQKTSSIFIPKEKVKRGKRGLITTTF